ncbi:MAG: sulfurtransferase TusA family protein [Desulfohalobiaceae bacterium]|nr:sulfurtransferase TusA family protein [Desulfohalobiaceae bacterium]
MMEKARSNLDLRCGIIPFSLLEVLHAIQEMPDGKVLEILGNDPEMKKELFKVLNPDCYELLEIQQESDTFRIWLRKKSRTGLPTDPRFSEPG